MTARDIINHTLITNKRLKGFESISDFGVDVLAEVLTRYAREKCLEAIKNTRYKSYDLVGFQVTGDQIVDKILQNIQRDIQNIKNKDVLPEL